MGEHRSLASHYTLTTNPWSSYTTRISKYTPALQQSRQLSWTWSVLHVDLSISAVGVFCVERGKFRPVATASLAGGGGTTGGPQRGGRVAVSFDALLAADRRAERVAEVLRRPVVDDWVDAGIEVRQAGAQHVDGVEPDSARWRP